MLLCSIKSVRCTREGVAGKDCGSDKRLSQLQCRGVRVRERLGITTCREGGDLCW